MELSQITTKTQKMLDMGIYMKEKYLCKRVKEGGGRLFKGAYFGDLRYLHVIVVVNSPHPSIVNEALAGLHCGV